MKISWIDVRTLGEVKKAVLEEASHQRIDGVVASTVDDLALLPPTVRRVLLLDGAKGVSLDAVDAGVVDTVIVANSTPELRTDIKQALPGAEFGLFVDVVDADSLQAACDAAQSERWTLIHFKDPTKIPLEIVLAAANNAGGNIITEVGDVTEAEIVLGVLERGSEGVMLAPTTVGDATRFKRACEGEPVSIDLAELSVVGIEHVGMGDRACVDTCTYMRKDEGILVGSQAKGMVLTCSETHPLPYMPTRPFRCNAGAVHSYTIAGEVRTNYLSELHAGSKVLAVDSTGRTRQVVVGRVKIEARPLLSIDLQSADGKPVNIIVQDDWHVRLLGPGGTVLNVTELTAGDKVLGYLPTAERHVGYPIDEFCIER